MNFDQSQDTIYPLVTATQPLSDLPKQKRFTPSLLPNLVVDQRIEAVFRCGAHHDCSSKSGEHACMIDLYQRNVVVAGFAEELTVNDFPPVDTLVRIEGVVIYVGDVPSIWVRSFKPLNMLSAENCIFDTARPQWICDQGVVDRATRLWATLPDDDRMFLNAVFLDPRVLRGFLMVPGSCRHHHSHDGGCIEHSVESAELAETLAASSRHLDRDLLITTALIHDSGKALEYTRTRAGKWQMSRYGRRVGHKISGIQLATIAMTRCPAMSGRRKEAYMHMLACSFAPSWVGLRKPDIPEATAMAGLDRSSAEAGYYPRVA